MNPTGIPAENARPESHVWGDRDRERARLLVERAGLLARRLDHFCRAELPGDARAGHPERLGPGGARRTPDAAGPRTAGAPGAWSPNRPARPDA